VVRLVPIRGLPLIEPGDPLPDLLAGALREQATLRSGDVLAIAQKVVSKAEGRIVCLADIEVSDGARELAARCDKDPRLVELILRESRAVIRVRPGLLVVEDRRGFICANAGIDRSNVQQGRDGEAVALLPLDPDASARRIRERILALTGERLGVIINDSHGRAFRLGTVGVAIGLAGVPAVSDRRGDVDLTAYTLQHTVVGIADEIAAAASLLMGPAAEGVPAVLVQGLELPEADAPARDLQRPAEQDLFR
jgi:coenzyme F420-0:L-glutamate ligase/coenzyme F420-1:gamma-L-glutamate ligase